MRNTYCGAVCVKNGVIILETNGEDINFSKELEIFWKKDIPVHITIKNDLRTLLNEDGCEIYLDRPNKQVNKYTYHINGVDIEQILIKNISKLIDIEIVHQEAEYESVYNS